MNQYSDLPKTHSSRSVWETPPLDLQSDHQQKIAELLDRYASYLEQGDETAAALLLDAHPELCDSWGTHLESLQALCRATRATRPKRNESTPETVDESILGDYRLNREIGRGGMGIVYEATQLSLRRSVALKVLPFAAVLDQQQVARFRNEAQAAASLHHPHIVPVFAVGCERGVHYYSMQLIDGQTLEQVFNELSPNQLRGRDSQIKPSNIFKLHNQTTIDAPKVPIERVPVVAASRSHSSAEKHGPSSLANNSTQASPGNHASTVQSVRSRNYVHDTVESIICVAKALDFAHNQGVVHRDIKPSNLLVDSTGKIWVADFGLARVRGIGNLTAEGRIVGTARYMSPEQIAGRPQEIDHRTDIYSLGITLYELLTLQPAFEGANREKLFSIIENEEPVPPRRLNPAVAIDLETIVLKAIAKSKSERYSTAGEMADDLRRFLDGKPTLARRPTPMDRAFKWAVRRQRLVCSSLAVLILAIIGLSATILMVTRQSRLKDQATARARLHLDQAHALVDRFGGLLNRRLANLHGTEELRSEILHEAERYYLDFLLYADQDETLRSELAKVQYRLAATYSELGDFDAAERKYQAAIAAYVSLRDQPQWNSGMQADMALCLHNLAALQKDSGRPSEAMKSYRQAGELQDQLLERTNPMTRFVQEWAMTRNNYGLLLWQCSDGQQAAELLNKTQSRLEEFLHRSPQALAVRQQLVECRNSLVAVLLEEDLDQAEELLKANIADLRSIAVSADSRPTDPPDSTMSVAQQSLACQLAVSLNNLATVLGRKGDRAQGVIAIQDSIQVLDGQNTDSHFDFEAQEQLAIANNNLGQLLWSGAADSHAADGEAAVAAFRLAEISFRTQLQQSPRRPESLSRLAGVLHNLGMVYQTQGSNAAAIDYMTEAMELQAQAVKQVPFHKAYRINLEKHRELLDQILSQFRDTQELQGNGMPVAVLPVRESVGDRGVTKD